MFDHSPQQKQADVKDVFVVKLQVKHSSWKPGKQKSLGSDQTDSTYPNHLQHRLQ